MTVNGQLKGVGDADLMENDRLSRRLFLHAAGGALGVTWLTLNWSEVANAAHDAHGAPGTIGSSDTSFLTPPEAADVAAIAAQIIPSDSTPGAREAGVVFFIDRGLATFFFRMGETFRAQLAEFRAECGRRNPTIESFAALSSERQVEFLRTVEHTPFFASVRMLTIIGMFAMPAYGGNRDGVGWKLLGFQDQHIFHPPFGYYDRDYPGFAIEAIERP